MEQELAAKSAEKGDADEEVKEDKNPNLQNTSNKTIEPSIEIVSGDA